MWISTVRVMLTRLKLVLVLVGGCQVIGVGADGVERVVLTDGEILVERFLFGATRHLEGLYLVSSWLKSV